MADAQLNIVCPSMHCVVGGVSVKDMGMGAFNTMGKV
jgi:hypothetical protein